jgi:hypothetical protein
MRVRTLNTRRIFFLVIQLEKLVIRSNRPPRSAVTAVEAGA